MQGKAAQTLKVLSHRPPGNNEGLLSAVIHCTHNCNFRCKYCYVEERTPGGRMAEETLRAIIAKLFACRKYDAIRFIWHGGEPLLCGLDFFRRVVALQNELGGESKRYSNGVQTNGSLLTEEAIEFFRHHRFRIGLSLDGPRQVNDSARVDKEGGGTYGTTLEKVELLQKHGLETGAIATVTRHNRPYPTELYELFRDHKLNLKCSQLVAAGAAAEDSGELRLDPEEYGDFLSALFDRWFEDGQGEIDVAPLRSMMESVLPGGGARRECIHTGACYRRFVGISPQGDVYPCGLFDGHREFCYGNIAELELDQLEKTPVYRLLQLREEVVRELCGGCEFYQCCHGGCPFSAYSNTGDVLSKDYYCGAFRAVFRHLVERIGSALEGTAQAKEATGLHLGGGGGGGGGGDYSVYSVNYSVYADYQDYVVTV